MIDVVLNQVVAGTVLPKLLSGEPEMPEAQAIVEEIM